MITQTYTISAPVSKVWAALTNPTVVAKWSGARAVMNAREGTEFKLWGGDIWGTNKRVVTNKLLEQEWYGGKWSKPSNVLIELLSNGSLTTVGLIHTDLPAKEEQNFATGWNDYYFGPMKEFLESA